MALTTIHGVSPNPGQGWVWHTNDWTDPVRVAPGKETMWVDMVVGQGPAVEVSAAGPDGPWTLYQAGGAIPRVTAPAAVVVRATGPSASFLTAWGPPEVLAANRAYEGHRGSLLLP